jgi:hypothetical protein
VSEQPDATAVPASWGVLKPGPLRGLRAFVIVAIACFMELVIAQALLLRPLLRPSLSQLRPPITVEIRYLDKLCFKLIALLRFVARDQFLLQRWYKRVHARVLAQLQAHPLAPEQRVSSVPTIEFDAITHGSFLRDHLGAGLPIVIKGGARQTEAFRGWSIEELAARFPTTRLKMVDLDTGEYLQATLAELVASRASARKLYVRNTANLVCDHPELVAELGCLDFRPPGRRPPFHFAGVQLFMGVRHGAGTDYHCATNINLNYQLRGRKRWLFVHPEYSWLMYPLINDHMMFCASLVPFAQAPEYNERMFPLYRQCPRMEVVVEPGDILLNPPWWWHAIEALDETSVSASTRWFGRSPVRANLFFDALNAISLRAWRIKRMTLAAPDDRMLLMRDEGNLELAAGNDDYTNFGKPSGKNLFDPEQWEPEHRLDRP